MQQFSQQISANFALHIYENILWECVCYFGRFQCSKTAKINAKRSGKFVRCEVRRPCRARPASLAADWTTNFASSVEFEEFGILLVTPL